ncbi:MAG TPA: hypothetical protein VIL20_13810 [Sandaracinaceae bacterium]
MKAPSVVRACALASIALASACGDLFGGDDAPPPPADPALAPAVETQPAPAPDPSPSPEPSPPAGTVTFPGLEGIPIPLPLPDANRPDPEPPARGSLAPAPAGTWDAAGHMTRPFLEQRAAVLHRALVAALDARENEQTRAIPFEVVHENREPNAAAGCTRATRSPVMMITTAMLELAAGIAETKAYDEVAGTDTYEQYVASVVDQVRRQAPVTGPSPSLHQAPHATDPHKLARQVHLFDQQIAFIVGHELAHHYRGHTGCVGGRTQAEIQRDELAQLLARTVPPFSQPFEVEADMWSVANVLDAGRNRSGGTWTQEGALLNLDFFRRLSDRGGAELVLAFLSTHPPAVIRVPIVRSAAQQWRPGWRPPTIPVPGQPGAGIELPAPGGPIRLPDPGQLPIDPSRLPFPLPQPRSP